MERARKTNKHHIYPKGRKGKSPLNNIIRLDINRHRAWHFLFGNKTFLEVAEMLVRAHLMIKGGGDYNEVLQKMLSSNRGGRRK